MSLVKNRVSICNYVCVFLLLALVCVQLFVPFYTFTAKDEVKEVSMGEYVWFPNETDSKALTNHFSHKDMFGSKETIEAFGEKFKIDEIAYPHLYTLILAGFGVVFCLLKNHSFVPSLFGLSAGVLVIYHFTANRAIAVAAQFAERVSSSSLGCILNIILGVLLILTSLFSMFGGLLAKLLAKKPVQA